MLFLGHPINIWIALLVVVIIKVRSDNTLTKIGILTSVLVSILSGVILYIPIMEIFTLAPSWSIFIAILCGLTAENIMKNVVTISTNIDLMKSVAEFFIKTKGDLKK